MNDWDMTDTMMADMTIQAEGITKTMMMLNLKDVHPYKRNPRKNDSAVDAVAESIQQCNYIAPIVIDEAHEILAGHTRYKALKKLGYKEAECLMVTGLTEEQKKKYRLLDNKTNELADWDFDLLQAELIDLDFGSFDFDFMPTTKEQNVNTNEELDLDDYEDDKFECECPRCGFRFNSKR